MLAIAKVLDKRHFYTSYFRNFLQVSSFYQKLRTPNRHAALPKKMAHCASTKVASAEAEAVANLANAAAKTREIPRPPEASWQLAKVRSKFH